MLKRIWLFLALAGFWIATHGLTAAAADPSWKTLGSSPGDRLLADYFRTETERIARAALADIKTKEDWLARRGTLRKELFEMLGLDPLPDRTPLKPVVTGTLEREGVVVERIEFQSMPGLYVTGDLYRPKAAHGKLPTILLLCGHNQLKINGVSFGNKMTYQNHACWYARNGYVCFTIDSVQLGEIEGIHHGTYKYGMWWWNSRGFTPAGVEAWNSIRALDYLASRPEVDADRFGVTGRSGGGAYSWWLGALDDRIKVAAPVAGITNLKNQVVDGCVEGHCDCMFPVNTYRWDFCQVAALLAPRPLLICNTDRDPIFPLDGVVDLYQHVRRIYELLGARDNLGLQLTPGPHADSQELHLGAFRWFNHYLKNDDRPIDTVAVPLFKTEELKVLDKVPADQRNSKIFESFVPAASPPIPKTKADWETLKNGWMTALKEKVFRGWPEESTPLGAHELKSEDRNGLTLKVIEFTSQECVPLRLYVLRRSNLAPDQIKFHFLFVCDEKEWPRRVAALREMFPDCLRDEAPSAPKKTEAAGLEKELKGPEIAFVYFAPRGIGLTAWNRDERKRTQIRRRFMLLGQTLDGMRVWDVRRAIQALRTVDGFQKAPLNIAGRQEMAAVVLYAALYEPSIGQLSLNAIPTSHRQGPDFLNVLRFLDLPQAAALAAVRTVVSIHGSPSKPWYYAEAVQRVASGESQNPIQIRADTSIDWDGEVPVP